VNGMTYVRGLPKKMREVLCGRGGHVGKGPDVHHNKGQAKGKAKGQAKGKANSQAKGKSKGHAKGYHYEQGERHVHSKEAQRNWY
jgi:hypothetical protein